jgi:hypothetical protein
MASKIQIEKLLGMSLLPRTLTGQPDLLQNVSFNNLGGWTTVGTSVRLDAALSDVQNVVDYDSGSVLYHKLSSDNAFVVQLEDESTEEIEITGFWDKNTLVQIDPQTVLSYDFIGDGVAVIQHGNYRDLLTPPLDMPSDIEVVCTPNIDNLDGPAPTSYSSTYAYSKGGRIGFSPDISNYIMMYVQEYTVDDPDLYSGTTLNPEFSKPFNRIPQIIHIPPQPEDELGNPIYGEYFVEVRIPSNKRVYFYGRGYPSSSTRQYYEKFRPGSLSLSLGTSVAEGDMWMNEVQYSTPTGEVIEMQQYFIVTSAGDLPSFGSEIDWNAGKGYGSKVVAGTATYTNIGPVQGQATQDFAYYVSDAFDTPLNYVAREDLQRNHLRVPTKFVWEMLEADGMVDGTDYVYTVTAGRSTYKNVEGFRPYTFYPVGTIAESHQGRSWMVAQAFYEVRAGTGTHSSILDIRETVREVSSAEKTVYYSEWGRSTDWPENFIRLSFRKSRAVKVMRSIGDHLIFIGEADACVLSGDTEANFRLSPLDIPGAYQQDLSVVIAGVLYYRGVGGIYRLAGGQPEKVSGDLNSIFVQPPSSSDSMTADFEALRLYYHFYGGSTYCFDILTGQWSQMVDGNLITASLRSKKTQPAVAFNAQKLYLISETHPHDSTLRAVFGTIDAGDAGRRKNYLSVSALIDLEAEPSEPYPQVRVVMKSLSSDAISTSEWQDIRYRSQMHEFRFRNIVGYAAEMTLEIEPNGSKVILRPPIAIEVKIDGEIRNRY